jgi:membrane associated rhomboid family serine protease
MMDHFALSWRNIESGRFWTALTSSFSHMTLSHLAFNMIAFSSIGIPLAQSLGVATLVKVYIASGLACSACFLAWDALNRKSNVVSIGASGSVSGLMVLYAMLMPQSRFLIFYVLPIRAPVAVGMFFAVDLLNLATGARQDISSAGHIGGALYGLYFARKLLTRF